MNNIYSIVGNVDLDLFDKKSNLLSKVVIPLKNKVEFYDSQLVTDYKLLKYSSDSEVLTGQIEKLTNYKQRKINLESRVKKLEKSDLPKDIRELNQLKQRSRKV